MTASGKTRQAQLSELKDLKNGLVEPKTPEKMADLNSKLEKLLDITTSSQKDLVTFQQETRERLTRMEGEMQNLKKDLSHIKKIEETLLQITEDLKGKETRLTDVEDAVENLREHNLRQDDILAVLEYTLKEKMLRIRGVPELDKEVTLSRIMPLLQEVWGLTREEILKEVDQIYRVNTRSSRNNSQPRDIVFSCVRRDLREELLRANSQKNYHLDGNKIIIMKELPASIQQRRKDYRRLTNLLMERKIKYRWIIPEGLSFLWKGKRMNVVTVPQAQEFLAKEASLPPTRVNSPNRSS
ncbi:golgin subfamily A member 3-like [Sphaerodactylus townsendi]|uniref:golgin subfamily A member 3-like n=1 Tax=Sphaerodactylus townsendi TaxID=933632 RepID=UPI0020274B30|nr:golgin subfamily A member 3-like [Sphaerodactylus townsendi]